MEEKKLGVIGKGLSVVAGPVLGLLPPRIQEKLTNYEAACWMSSSSRIFNTALSLATLVSLGTRTFGVDIDPTQGNIATNIGIGIGIDTVLREAAYKVYGEFSLMLYYGIHLAAYIGKYEQLHFTHHSPWGEPIISAIDKLIQDSKLKPVDALRYE